MKQKAVPSGHKKPIAVSNAVYGNPVGAGNAVGGSRFGLNRPVGSVN
jgi:hypothetical protein